MEKKTRIKRKRKLFIDKKTFQSYDGFATGTLSKIQEDLGEKIINAQFIGRFFRVKTASGIYNYEIVCTETSI